MFRRNSNLRRLPRDGRARPTLFGFSIYDMLITTSVAGILGIGAVGFTGLIQDAHMTTTVNQLMGDLNLARSEAIKRHTNVVLCKSTNGIDCTRTDPWNRGWIVFADTNNNYTVDVGEPLIRVQATLDGRLTLRYGETGSYYYVRYNAQGEVWPGATFSFCDPRGATQAKAVIVYWTGRPRVSSHASDGGALRCS